jgi:hypothetical protein
MEHESIVRKIQKLFSLAQSSNEAEANLAMATAQSLLAQYNLEAAVVRGTHVAGGTVAPEPEKRERTKIPYSAFYNYQRLLWRTLAEANFCWYWVADTTEVYNKRTDIGLVEQHRKVKRHMLLGTEANVIVVRMMGEYLEDTMERILPYPHSERLSKSAISWKTGCTERLVQRIQKLAAERREQMRSETVPNSNETGIALRDVIQAEYQANYDAAYGEGAWLKAQMRSKEYSAKRELEEAEKQQRLLNESPAEKRARLKQEAIDAAKCAKENAKWQRQWDAKQRARVKNIDAAAYWEGHSTANDIGLDGQVASGGNYKRVEE